MTQTKQILGGKGKKRTKQLRGWPSRPALPIAKPKAPLKSGGAKR
jgi:hypothetical protein